MPFVRCLRSVLASFLGIRRSAQAAADLEHVSPATLIVTGVLTAAVLVLTLVSLARWVAGGAT